MAKLTHELNKVLDVTPLRPKQKELLVGVMQGMIQKVNSGPGQGNATIATEVLPTGNMALQKVSKILGIASILFRNFWESSGAITQNCAAKSQFFPKDGNPRSFRQQ